MIVSQDDIRLLLGLSSSITDDEQAVLTLVHPLAEGAVKDYLKYDPEQKVHTEYLPRHDRSGGPGYEEVQNEVRISGNMAYWTTGVGPTTLQLTHIPLRAVTSVYVDTGAMHGDETGSFAESTKWTPGDDYWMDWDEVAVARSGQLKAYGSWPDEPGTVKVTYRAGYSPAEFLGTATTTSTAADGTVTTAGVSATGIVLAVHSTAMVAFSRFMSMRKKAGAGWTSAPLQSENLGDYSYTVDTSGLSAAGVAVALPDDAKQYLAPYLHYGVWRL